MKFKAALFYQDTLVYYSIYHLGEQFFKARLDEECLEVTQAPPLLELRREHRFWSSDCQEREIVKELGAAIEQRLMWS